MTKYRYFLPVLLQVIGIYGILVGGWWSYAVLIISFGWIPLLELLWQGNEDNLRKEQEQQALRDRSFDFAVYSAIPLHVAAYACFFWRLSTPSLDTFSLVGILSTMGILNGVFGINVAHELGHRRKRHEQWMAQFLLWTTMYMHFFIEHNRGHHVRVATQDDPASARYGETLYGFWWRSVSQSYISAWELENTRLQKRNLPWFSVHNQMLRFQLYQLALACTIGFVLGAHTLLLFLTVSAMGILLLESVNYLEHYGLQRKRLEHGKYERTLPIHSWNSNHPLGRVLLFELSRHSDHHAHASRKYQILRHFDQSPQLPTGYPGMILLALIPPLWFWVMHRHIEKHLERLQQHTIPSSAAS
ncbi:MAG: alkane 1-monooxygenase [Myxococcota bacterium]